MKKFSVLFFSIVAISCSNNIRPAFSTDADSTLAVIKKKQDILDKNKATALASVQAWNSANVDGVFKDFDMDGIDYGSGSMAPVKGLALAKANAKAFLDAFPDIKGENFFVVGEGNHVAVFADWSGTFKNPLMNMKPTGKMFKMKDVDLFTFNDAGKIIEHRSVQPAETILNQVGAKMK